MALLTRSHDRTSTFRSLLNERGVPSKPLGDTADVFLAGCLQNASSSKEKDALEQRRKADKEWVAEARRIYKTIISLFSFQSSIRRPYLLHTDSGIPRPGPAEDGESISTALNSSDPFARWKQLRHMNDKQRDELDFQVRVMLKRCMEQIRELEKAEEIRKRTSPTSHTAANPITFLRALSSSTNSVYSAAYSEQLALHRSSICHHLSSLLAEAGNRQRDMQERRVRVKRNKELRDPTANVTALKGRGANSASAIGSVGAVHGSTRAIKLDPSLAPMLDDQTSGKGGDVLSTLSSEQIQQFESENSALLQSLQNDLASVQQAESKLYAISELQTQLLQHLGQQAEMTDRLLEESVNHTSEVGQGNTQLRKAKERSREANKFLSIFLVGSGLGLLFLHWMD